MKILVTILIVGAAIWLIVTLIRSHGSSQAPTFATRDQIPSIISKLRRTGSDGSFIVFMFAIPSNHHETLPNIQYSIENGKLGFDWVLLAPQNIRDEARLTDFIKRVGYAVSKQEMNDVAYLRVDGNNLEDLGISILRDFYHLPLDAKLELVVGGFSMLD